MAAARRRPRAGQARRHAAGDQVAGGRRHRHRLRRRAVAPAFRARLSRIRRRHRLRPQGRDGHPRQPLQSHGADRARRIAAQGPRARGGGAPRPRAHQAQVEDHHAGADDHRRHHRRRALRRQDQHGDGLRRPAQRGSARAGKRRRRRRSSSTSRPSTSSPTRSPAGAIEALHRAIDGLTCTTAVHICYGYGIKANIDWKNSLGGEWRQYEEIFPALAKSRIEPGLARMHQFARADETACRCSTARTC